MVVMVNVLFCEKESEDTSIVRLVSEEFLRPFHVFELVTEFVPSEMVILLSLESLLSSAMPSKVIEVITTLVVLVNVYVLSFLNAQSFHLATEELSLYAYCDSPAFWKIAVFTLSLLTSRVSARAGAEGMVRIQKRVQKKVQ